MIAVGRAATSMMGSIIKQIWPQLISWGINKLINSNFGNSYIPPGFHGPIFKIGHRLGAYDQDNQIYDQPRIAGNGRTAPNLTAPRIERKPTVSFHQAPLVQSQQDEQHQLHKYAPIKHRKSIMKSRFK